MYVIVIACIIVLVYAVLKWIRTSQADAFQVQERLLSGLLALAILGAGAFVSVLIWDKLV